MNELIQEEEEELSQGTILLKKETRELLKTKGIKGESYDTIIIRLIDHWDNTHERNDKK